LPGGGAGPRFRRKNWFESNFIVAFFAVRLAALIFAIAWEWRHPDPVVEIRLLGDRICLGEYFYFLFGFTRCMDPTVLMSADSAAALWVHGDGRGAGAGGGAFVIVMLAPVVVRILPKLGVKKLLAFGYFVFALAMWYFASFTLATDYRHEAWARRCRDWGLRRCLCR